MLTYDLIPYVVDFFSYLQNSFSLDQFITSLSKFRLDELFTEKSVLPEPEPLEFNKVEENVNLPEKK